MENMEENSEMIWKIWQKKIVKKKLQKIVKRYDSEI